MAVCVCEKTAVEDAAPWKSPRAGHFHLALKSRKGVGISTSSTVPFATSGILIFPFKKGSMEATPPANRRTFHNPGLDEIPQERVVCSHNRRNFRGVKRKMSNFPLRPRHLKP